MSGDGPTGPDPEDREPSADPRAAVATGQPLYVVESGSGPPVVLVHGFGASRFTWREWTPTLARDHRVLEVDLKGFGDAPAPPRGSYSPLDQAGHLRDLVLERGLEGAVLVGHSLGGAVALLAALDLPREGPGSVAGLVVVAGSCYPQDVPPFISLARVPILGALVLGLAPKRRLFRTVLRSIVHDPGVVTREMAEGYARPYRRRATRRALVRAARQLLSDDADALVARYRELDVPALLVWGREDEVVPPRTGERLVRDLPHARLEVIEACGHMPMDERPAETLALVRTFLDGVRAGRGRAPDRGET